MRSSFPRRAARSVWPRGRAANKEVTFEVQDQGAGIPAEKLDLIFDRFQQADASDSRLQGGTGLGLALCRGIINQHGGRIWADKQSGQRQHLLLHGGPVRAKAEAEDVVELTAASEPRQRLSDPVQDFVVDTRADPLGYADRLSSSYAPD